MLTHLFLSTLSLRRATGAVLELQCVLGNFYPRSPCGERQSNIINSNSNFTQFLSTLSLRRATTGEHPEVIKIDNFYPRSPCGERHVIASRVYEGNRISIHALLAESDLALIRYLINTYHHFYPRSPCGERRRPLKRCRSMSLFLSTLSLRRATEGAAIGHKMICHFYPRSPCGERRQL